MEFVLHCLDKPHRASLRVPHLTYAQVHEDAFRYGGPLFDDTGRTCGSLMILQLPDRAALDAHMRGDPFFTSDLFASVSIHTTRQVLPELMRGGLAREIDAARALTHELSNARALAAAAVARNTMRIPLPLRKVSGQHAA